MTAVGRKDILILGGILGSGKGNQGSAYKYDVEANELQEVIACAELPDSEESEGDDEE